MKLTSDVKRIVNGNFSWELQLELWFHYQYVVGFAVGNVLLLKNNLNLSPDIAEVSQEKLLSLVAERLIDSNSNVNVITGTLFSRLL